MLAPCRISPKRTSTIDGGITCPKVPDAQIAPVASLGSYPALSIDGKETGTFRERWKSPDTQISPGGFFGIGIDFKLVGQSSVSVMVGLEVLPMNKKIDGMDDYSGRLIHISFNRRSK